MSVSRFAHGVRAPYSVSIFALALGLFPLAGHSQAQSVLTSDSTLLGIDDVAITPDGHYAVVRQNHFQQFARVYDLATGALVADPAADSNDGLLGECLDAVAVTNTRAVVLGNRVQILDLTNLANPILGAHRAGFRPRDVVITPDGTIACVRGGSTGGGPAGMVGGSYLFSLATGAQLGFHPGEPTPYGAGGEISFDVDAVAATNTHAVMTSFLDNGNGTGDTRVAIWELHPSGGGPPVVALETGVTLGTTDQMGSPYDLAITPDGTKAFVRSDLEVGAYDLSVSPPAVLWLRGPARGAGPTYEEALDSIEVTNDRVLTISRLANGTGTQVDVFDANGTDYHSGITGSPHDLAITPDGTRGFVRTSTGVFLYDLVQLPAGQDLPVLSEAPAPAAAVLYFAGLDSVAVTDSRAVTLCRLPTVGVVVHFWDISGPSIVEITTQVIPHNYPTDVAITPDGTKAVVTGDSNVSVFDVATGATLLTHTPCPVNAYFPWCNGVAVNNERAVGVSQWNVQAGWVAIVDIAPLGASFCVGAPNSAGAGARISAAGTSSVGANDLKLFVRDAPANVLALFEYGTTAVQTPYGNGFRCVGGSIYRLAKVHTNEAGSGWIAVDNTTLPAGGQINPGSTWFFQCAYRDRAAGGAFFNASDAVSIDFRR
jgi:hypothetical protein